MFETREIFTYLLIHFSDSTNEVIPKKDLSFIRINWMGAKTRDNKIDWLYPTTQYNYDGNLPKKYRYCFGAKKTKKSNQIHTKQ